MIKHVSLIALACVLLATTACITPLPQGKSGVVAMVPFTSEAFGIQGNAPLEGWSDQAILNQESFPGTIEELVTHVVEQTDLVQLPRSTGVYQGAHLTWDLYTFTTQIPEGGPGLYRVDMATAKAEPGAGLYLVTLITRPMEYGANRALYETVLEHALYALEPLD
jgi:hypothetical protein